MQEALCDLEKDRNVLVIPGKVEDGFGTEGCRNEIVHCTKAEGMWLIRCLLWDRQDSELEANTEKGLMHMKLINLSEFILHCRGHLPLFYLPVINLL